MRFAIERASSMLDPEPHAVIPGATWDAVTEHWYIEVADLAALLKIVELCGSSIIVSLTPCYFGEQETSGPHIIIHDAYVE